jgi:hypothetical protein
MVDYKKRAEECRRLAKLTAGAEHWAAFLEMAETWEKLAELHELGRKLRSSGVLLQAPTSQEKFEIGKVFKHAA